MFLFLHKSREKETLLPEKKLYSLGCKEEEGGVKQTFLLEYTLFRRRKDL